MPKTILIADDNSQITSILSEYAKKEGYMVELAYDGKQALDICNRNKIDLVLLDVTMPIMDGFEVCKAIREYSSIPIIMITARGEDYDKIMGLDMGADDYIVKPFSPGEVMARVRAILRRVGGNQEIIEFKNIKIDVKKYVVEVDKKVIRLTKKEIEILWVLMSNIGKVFTRDNLLDSVWGYEHYGDSRTVDSHIKRLRSKLNNSLNNEWEIKTVWGVGYQFEVNENET